MGVGCASGWIPTSWAYFNAMGLTQNNTGFVTRISFMLAACLSAAFIYIYIFFWTKKSSKQISSRQFTSCSTVMMFGIALGYYCNTTHVSSEPIAVLLGIFFACGNALIDLSWLSKISEIKICSPIPALVIASCTSSVAILIVNQFEYSLTIAVLMIALTCASAFLYSKSNNQSNMTTNYSSIKNARERQGIVSALLCMLVCELIVAIANVAIHDTFFSSIMSNVNMDIAAVIAVLLTVLMYAIGNKRVDLAKAYKFWMIIMLLIFSFMPFFSQQMSSSGYVMAICWNFLGIACAYYLTQTIRVNRLNPTLYFSMAIFFR